MDTFQKNLVQRLKINPISEKEIGYNNALIELLKQSVVYEESRKNTILEKLQFDGIISIEQLDEIISVLTTQQKFVTIILTFIIYNKMKKFFYFF